MATEILMPELGESVHEGTVSRWLKKVGDSVKEDEPVVEIMTDKVNTELQAPASGVLTKILIPEGENVKVFEALGLIGEASEVSSSASPVKPEPAPTVTAQVPTAPSVPQQVSQPVANGGRRFYTPVVRSIAKQHNVSDAQLAGIAGSGEGGRVTKRDVEVFISAPRATTATAAPPEFKPAPSIALGPEQEIVALVGIRKAIADAMVRAHEIPSVSTVAEVDVTKLVEFRAANKESFQAMHGVKLTYTPFFIKATTEALLQFPYVNSHLGNDGKLVVNHGVHMGVAVALGDGTQGLVVPVIRDCHKKSLVEIARDLESIAKKARDSKLEIADYQGGTFALTNPGTYGALFGTPMIPAGMTGILGTYSIKETVVAKDGWIGVRPIMHLVLSYDHRVVDGMLAGMFLKAVREKLQGFDFFR